MKKSDFWKKLKEKNINIKDFRLISIIPTISFKEKKEIVLKFEVSCELEKKYNDENW